MFVVSFVILIFIGTVLLTLPISAKSGRFTNPVDALFTATSAACVTGLSVYDTFIHWSYFGQGVLLVLIQCGGLGLAAFATGLTLLVRRRIGIRHLVLARESAGGSNLDVISLLRIVVAFTFAVEALGALLLMARFVPLYGGLGVWASVFVSVSAFCNAGFDLMSSRGGGSLMAYAGDPLVNLTIMGLIVAGGLGFLTWADFSVNRLHWRKWTFQTRIILLMTALLVAVPALLFFTQEPISGWQALFQSVTTRTAGFNTMDIETLSEGSRCIMIILMLTGGAPGSTAGGIKTTTAFALFMTMVSVLRMRGDVECQSRRIPTETVRHALAIFVMYLFLFFGASIAIGYLDRAPMIDAMVEVSSALGTVGLSIGLTEKLSPLSQIMLMFLMYFGRVGALTMIYALHKRKKAVPCRLPEGRLTVG